MQADTRRLNFGTILWQLYFVEIDFPSYRDWKERYASR